jgi:hypothetical protein
LDCSALLTSSAEVLSEEVILKWYKDGHVPKGWTVYGEQMKKFVEWLEHAESGGSCFCPTQGHVRRYVGIL